MRIGWSLILALVLWAVPLTAWGKAGEEERQTGQQGCPGCDLSLRREEDLRREAGLLLWQWEELVSEAREEGLREGWEERQQEEEHEGEGNAEEEERLPLGPVQSVFDAYRLLYRLLPSRGAEEGDFLLWSVLEFSPGPDSNTGSLTVYSFQEVEGGRALPGRSVKIAVEGETVTGVFCDLEEAEEQREEGEKKSGDREAGGKKEGEGLLTSREAEILTARELGKEGCGERVLWGRTERVIRSLAGWPSLDFTREDLPGEALFYVVYSQGRGEDAPLRAHYVALGEEEREENQESGKEKEEQGGKEEGEREEIDWDSLLARVQSGQYLGEAKRRILVADYASLVYGGRLVPESRGKKESLGEKEDWDPQDLFFLENFERAYDFFASLGWEGPGDEGEPVLLLKDLCTREGEPYPGVFYLGRAGGCQVFAYAGYRDREKTEPVGLVRCLDVLAHEYSHALLLSVMNTCVYANDSGAINEGLADILGNLAQRLTLGGEGEGWLLGEEGGEALRSFTEPERYGQPSRVWGRYYAPTADPPLASNDRGGVHVNSSLLCRLAALLCEEAGMGEEDALSLWLTFALGLTPGMDYEGAEEVLTWALQSTGLQEYREDLQRLLFEEEKEEKEILTVLTLPDTPAFADPNWVLFGFPREAGTCRYMSWPEAGTGRIPMVTGGEEMDYLLVNLTEAGTRVKAGAVLVEERWQALPGPSGQSLAEALEEARGLWAQMEGRAPGEAEEAGEEAEEGERILPSLGLSEISL